ncbi:hypothetical protein [Pyrobaculum calidifontis]|uniref:Uncharacterized protein n=1 Tax=Pyrobaculum calidifontis (strain DSM 21063 / JCM 11548 / VA1) TaxID=410359 RepID=A3MUZ3_PYRCJ|nr:hypothetical protein [Pyrobaculum calidifontis]ABO08460.1 hypothetical protein Pcal_1035 [Pyrobaculum calidifontis JCM 11548]
MGGRQRTSLFMTTEEEAKKLGLETEEEKKEKSKEKEKEKGKK